MEDYIVRATAAHGTIRAFVATSKKTVETARQLHNMTPVSTAALGRLMIATAMIGATLKNDRDLVTLQIKGDGPLQGILATSDSKSRVKGYAFNPGCETVEKYPGKLDVGEAVGGGILSVIMDVGLKEPYSGQIELVSGEIAEDLTYYYYKSEQTPSAIALGVLIDTDFTVKEAGGFMIQLLSDATDEVAQVLEKKIATIPYISDLYDMGMTPEDILKMILGDMDLEIKEKVPMDFYCNCSKGRVEKALISIGAKELGKVIEEDKKASLRCHFCNKSYDFTEEELVKLLKEAFI